jgi:heptosyltransferase-2
VPEHWPEPELSIPQAEIAEWRAKLGFSGAEPLVALAPGAVGWSKRWPASSYGAVAKRLVAEGFSIAVVGGPGEKPLAAEIVSIAGKQARDLTGPDLRNAILALAAADVAVSNDSGLLHVAAAAGTRSIGIFGPTSPWHWAPLNPLAAIIEPRTAVACRPCHKPTCRFGHHRCMREIGPNEVLEAARAALVPA